MYKIQNKKQNCCLCMNMSYEIILYLHFLIKRHWLRLWSWRTCLLWQNLNNFHEIIIFNCNFKERKSLQNNFSIINQSMDGATKCTVLLQNKNNVCVFKYPSQCSYFISFIKLYLDHTYCSKTTVTIQMLI